MEPLSDLDDEIVELEKRLFKFAYSLTHNIHYAQDLVQETYCKIYSHKKKFIDKEYPVNISMTFLKNIFITDLRSIKRIHYCSAEECSDLSDDTMKIDHDYNYLVQVLKALDKDNRLLVGLLIQGKKYKEIAEILDIPLGTVKSRINKLRKRLRKELGEFF